MEKGEKWLPMTMLGKYFWQWCYDTSLTMLQVKSDDNHGRWEATRQGISFGAIFIGVETGFLRGDIDKRQIRP
jgi:hypothetical protein